jgi:PAS domain S-box-containing protein
MDYSGYLDMLRYVGWGSGDAAALAELATYVEPRTAEIAEEFYDRVREHPEADAIFRDEAQVRRLQQTLQRWLLEMLRGPYDEAYFDAHCQIGRVHARIGVPQRYVFAAMSVIRLHLARIALAAFAGDHARDERVRIALGKALDVELAIMLETYRAALLERLERVDRQKREGMAQRLAAAEKRYRDAIESSPAIVMVLDEEERPLVWNVTAARVTGYDRDEMLDQSPLDLLMPDEAVRARVRAVEPDSADAFEGKLVARAGRERHVRWSVSCTLDTERGTLVRNVLGIDMTEVREAERRARSAERLAAVGTMAAGLAHEIRNPLNAASLHVTLLERALKHLPGGDGSTMDATLVLRSELKRLSSLVSEFLDFARPRPIRPTPVDLAALVDTVVDLLAPDADAARVNFSYERPRKDVWAELDEERLRQVIINLVRNAIEAASGQPGGSVILRVRRVGAYAELDVEDNGPGIPEGVPVFDAFFTTKEHGTGLGLSIVHRIVDDHAGNVMLRSQPGSTVFTVRLPATTARENGSP